jgi:micrococcal nuclease
MSKLFVIALILSAAAIYWRFLDVRQGKPLAAERRSDTVRYVIDGDTLILSRQERRIRLWGVDAPEEGEQGYHAARNELVAISEGQRITYQQQDVDRYGRIVARVFLRDGREINRMMIESGTAREYRRYSKGFYTWATD